MGPNLISQDLRYNALPLYFSRPLRRSITSSGNWAIIAALLAAVIIVPSCVAYVLGLLFSLDITIVRDTSRILLASVAYGLVIAVSAGTLMLALSSLSRNSRYVALFWMGIWILSSTVSWVLMKVEQEQRRHEAGVHSPHLGERGVFERPRSKRRSPTGGRWFPIRQTCAGSASICCGPMRPGSGSASCRRPVSEVTYHVAADGQSISLVLVGRRAGRHYSCFPLCILNFSIKSLDRLK